MFNNFNSQIKISLHIRSVNPLSTKNLKFWCMSALSSFFLYILYLYPDSWKVFFLSHYKYLSPFNFRIFTNLISLPGKNYSRLTETPCAVLFYRDWAVSRCCRFSTRWRNSWRRVDRPCPGTPRRRASLYHPEAPTVMSVYKWAKVSPCRLRIPHLKNSDYVYDKSKL